MRHGKWPLQSYHVDSPKNSHHIAVELVAPWGMCLSSAKQTIASLVLSSIVVQVRPSWLAVFGQEVPEEKNVSTPYVTQPS